MSISDLNQSHLHEKIENGLAQMLYQAADLRFFAEFLMFVNFGENNTWCPTMAAGIQGSSPKVWWNRKFVDSITMAQCNFVLVHECMHLLGNHSARAVRLKHMTTDFSDKLANIAMDMVINSTIVESNYQKTVMDMPDGWVIPSYYKGDRFWEEVYLWLLDQKDQYDQWKKQNPDKVKDMQDKQKEAMKKAMEQLAKEGRGEKQDGDGEKSDNGTPQPDPNGTKEDPNGAPTPGNGDWQKETFSDGCPVEDKLRRLFEGEDGPSFDVHDMLKDMPEELREAMVKDIVQGLKNRGLVSANIEAMLEKINPTKKDYLKDILSGVAFIKGKVKMDTFKRMNRRSLEGLKGKVKIGAEINVVLDVSGSMSGYIEKVLSVIFRDGITCNVAQCDAKVNQIVKTTKRSDIQKMKIEGFGGTTLQPAIDMFKADKDYRKLNIVVLTDGVCDSLDLSGFRKALVVTCAEKVPITKGASHMRTIHIKEGK